MQYGFFDDKRKEYVIDTELQLKSLKKILIA